MSVTTSTSIGRRISDNVNTVHRMAAITAPELAALLRGSAERSVDRATIVVVGEAKRGKSSLVNALIGRPGVSPVAAAVATACPVVLSHAATDSARVRLVDGQELGVPLGELRDWVAGAHAERVLGVEIGLDAPALSNFTIIDTPGIGGILPAHTAMALGALSQATAVLFVCDPTAPLSRPELDFVAEVARSVDTVLMALTKTDVHPHWRSLLDQDRRLLAEAVPRLADGVVFPVSSRLAARAANCEDPSDAARLREEAGVAAIESTLHASIVPRARALGAANTLRVSLSVCDDLERRALARSEAAAANPDLLQAAETERARLVELNRENASWGSTLDYQLSLIRLDVLGEVGRRISESRRTWDEALSKGTPRDEAQLTATIAAEIAEIDASLRRTLVDRMTALTTSTLGDLIADGSLAATLERLGRRDDERLVAELPKGGGVSGLDMLGAMGGFSMGRMLLAALLPEKAQLTATIAGVVGMSAATFTVAAPVLAGVSLMAVAMKLRGSGTRRGELRTWSRGAFDEAAVDLRSTVERGITEAKFACVAAMRATISRRIDEVTATIATHNEALKLDAAARNALRAEANQQVRDVREVAAKVRCVLAELLEASAKTPALRTPPPVGSVRSSSSIAPANPEPVERAGLGKALPTGSKIDGGA